MVIPKTSLQTEDNVTTTTFGVKVVQMSSNESAEGTEDSDKGDIY